MLARLVCALVGHSLIIPTGAACWTPIYCRRCTWRGP